MTYSFALLVRPHCNFLTIAIAILVVKLGIGGLTKQRIQSGIPISMDIAF